MPLETLKNLERINEHKIVRLGKTLINNTEIHLTTGEILITTTSINTLEARINSNGE